jgi:hypothetical protein
MTPLREAILLPCTLLTVALLGGLRVAGNIRLDAPSIVALMLAIALVGTLARAGALAPERLVNAHRSTVENMNGAVVLVTLFAASAQIFNLLTPERGLLFALFTIYFTIQILTALAGVTGRASLLRSLAVLFTAAFVLRFVVLENLYAPDGRVLKRVLTTVLEGVSLGGIEYAPNAPITGYVAFLTLVLYMIGLILLPSRDPGRTLRWSPGAGGLTRPFGDGDGDDDAAGLREGTPRTLSRDSNRGQ